MENPLDAALSDQPAEDVVLPEAALTALPASPGLPPEGGEKGPLSKAEKAGETPALPVSPEASEAPVVPASPALPPEGGEKAGQVPLSSLLDEREKRQGAEKALKALQDRLEQERSDWQKQNPPTPEEQRSAERYADNLRISRKFASKEYGPEFIETVHDWALGKCDADPLFNQQMRSSDDPYEDAVQAYRREEILKLVSPADLDAFRAWQAAHSAQQAQTQQPTPATQASPPRSLADAPGNGATGAAAVVNRGDGEAFRAALG